MSGDEVRGSGGRKKRQLSDPSEWASDNCNGKTNWPSSYFALWNCGRIWKIQKKEVTLPTVELSRRKISSTMEENEEILDWLSAREWTVGDGSSRIYHKK